MNLFTEILRSALPRPLDFLKSETWLANVGHVLGGYAIVLTAAYWAHGPHAIVVTSWALGGYVVVKEYVLDLLLESDETWVSSTIDALGYAAGAGVAWAEVLARAS